MEAKGVPLRSPADGEQGNEAPGTGGETVFTNTETALRDQKECTVPEQRRGPQIPSSGGREQSIYSATNQREILKLREMSIEEEQSKVFL